jgi:hypothetical protein
MNVNKEVEVYNQQDRLNLNSGDKAYLVVDMIWGTFDLVTIISVCEQGDGYLVNSPWWKKSEPSTKGNVHTCNSYLYKTKKEARINRIESLKRQREIHITEQRQLSRDIQYIDYLLKSPNRANYGN